MERPRLDFSTILDTWKPEFAYQVIDLVERNRGTVKPGFFTKIQLLPSATEAEKFTLSVVQQMCIVAFGTRAAKQIPARKQIALANANWVEHHVPLGKGIDFEGLRRFIDLYTKHLHEDNQSGRAQ